MKDNAINYDRARYSLAIIDFKNYIQLLNGLDKQLEEPTLIVNYVLRQNENSDILLTLLNDHAFVPLARIQKSLKKMEKNIVSYQTQLEAFLTENPKEYSEFYAYMDIFVPLHQEKKAVVEKQIGRCFEYIKTKTENLTI